MLKSVVLALFDRCGVNAAVRGVMSRRLLTLCYHSVLPDAEIGTAHCYRNTVGIDEMREQLETLGRWFHFASPAEVLAAAEGGPLRRRSVLITFDDGHDNLRRYAAPLLASLGVPAVIHISTGHIGTGVPLWTEELEWIVAGWRGDRLPLPNGDQRVPVPAGAAPRAVLAREINDRSKRLPDDERRGYLAKLREEASLPPPQQERDAFRFLDWDGVRELHRGGFVIGSHTVNHPILSRTTPDQLDSELQESKRHIETELRVECPWIAYPNGSPRDVSPTVLERARAAGYRAGFTTWGAFDEPAREPLAIGRICVPGRLPRGAFRAMASGVQQWASRLRGSPY